MLTLPGVRSTVRAYAVTGLHPRPAKVRGVEGLHAGMVGREAELAQLSAALDKMRQGEGRIVMLAGGAGVGKSRLVGELEARCIQDASPSQPPLLWLEGRGQAYAGSTAYHIFADLLAGCFGPFANACDPAPQPAPISHRLEGLDHLSKAGTEEIALLLGRLLGARSGEEEGCAPPAALSRSTSA